MAGIELRDGTLVVQREPNELDTLAIEFSDLLGQFDIEHVYIAGYVAILAGRARATKDVDVLVETIDEGTASALADALERAGFWGPAMPLSSMHEMLERGDPLWIARDEEMAPHIEISVASDEFDRASLENAMSARIGNERVPIGPLELQIAYKLSLGAQKDIEDAVHLYTLLGESLSESRLEAWANRLDVMSEYERLKHA